MKAEEFVRKIKDRYKEVKVVLIKSQEEMKRYVDKNRKETKEYKVGDKVLISMKDFLIELMKGVIKKLMEKYIGPYIVKKNYIRKCSRVGVISIIKNISGS